MRHLRIALVGIGAIAGKRHLMYLEKAADVTVEAIVDIDVDRAKGIAREYSVEHFFENIDSMISSVEVDAILICTPNQTHIPIAKKAAERGIHVFVEKPIGTKVEEVNEYLELAKKRNVLTMVGMTHRFRSEATILKEYADRHAFGEIYYTKAKLFRRRNTPKGWFTNKALAGGGTLMDAGVHVLDLAWWLMGEPKVQSITGKTIAGLGKYETKYVSTWESKNKLLNSAEKFDVEDFGSAWIRFTNGAVLLLEIAWAMNGEQDDNISIELLGNKGGATISPLAIYKEEEGVMVKSSPLFEEKDPFKEEIDHFIECVRTKTNPLISGEDGYEVLKMLQGIYASSEQEQEIKFQ